jgi:hypothetical protein
MIAALALGSATPGGASRAVSAAACQKTYDYAGAQDSAKRSGIRANIKFISPSRVEEGHVAGWLGVGGPGLGPNGSDEWLQTGYVSFHDGRSQIYYEMTVPGKPPQYHTVKETVSPSETHRLAELEVGGKNGVWRVWLDDKAVTPEISLPQSHGRFVPQALAETWNAGSTKCNHYAYRFEKIQVAKAPGGSWATPKAGYVWKNEENLAKKVASGAFEARSTAARAAAPAHEPPLLGSLVSKLTGRPLTAECVTQPEAVRESPPQHLRLSQRVCERLLGYAVAQPYGPAAGSGPGFAVAATALAFLRGVARAAQAPAGRTDCRAVGYLYRTARALGATSSQALAYRTALLQKRARLAQKLALHSDCPFH